MTAPGREPGRWARLVEPRATGLPNWRVVVWYPALVLLVLGILTVLTIGGTSSGVYWSFFGVGDDPRLLAGTPRLIRSDEWLVNLSWTVSQFQWGLPAQNPSFPGGFDAAVAQELPNLDGSVAFRPHAWGYLLFGLHVGAAWFWWLPAVALAAGAYLLFVTFVPRRPITGALLATAVVFFPLFQWIWGPNTLWPAAWAMLVLAAVRWSLVDDRRWVRIVWAGVSGYLAVTTALGLYVPFIVPCVLLVVAVTIGLLVDHRRRTGEPLRRIAGRMAPLAVAAVGAAAAVGWWALTHADALRALGGTVYPGFRSTPSGALLTLDRFLAGTAGAPFDGALSDETAATVLGANASDAATVPLLALLLLPGLIVLLVRARRRDGFVDAIVVAVLALIAIVLLYQFVPGLDVLGRALLLDRVTPTRFRILLAVLVPLVAALVVREVDRDRTRWAGAGSIAAAALAAGSVAWVLFWIARRDPELLAAGAWPLLCLALIVAGYAIFVRRLVPLGAAALLVVSVGAGAGANPLYAGVFDLRTTAAGQAVQAVAEEPGAWVAVGPAETVAVLMQSGVEQYSGFQTQPSRTMWHDVDPTGEAEEMWNRMAHVRWEFGSGEPVLQLYGQGIIVTSFDACSDFAAEHVRFVLTNTPMPATTCARELRHVVDGATESWIYEVLPR